MKKTLFFLVIFYNSLIQSQTFNGNLGSQSLNWTMEQKDFNSLPRIGIAPMSIKLWDNYLGLNAPSEFGSLLEINGRESHLTSQIYFDNTWDGGRILYRSAFYSQDTWESWRYLLDSKSDVESTGNLKIKGNSNSYILNGKVGIGSANPDQKLTVKGKIHAEEIIVDLAVPADYVFQKYYTGKSELKSDYIFPTLPEIENFTKKNNHLPGVPSAKEMKEKGISLGEMSNILLQKIEELTLYTIEQQKELERLDAENNIQSKKIEILEKENDTLKELSIRISEIENLLK